MSTDTRLTDFLTARLDEAEATATAVSPFTGAFLDAHSGDSQTMLRMDNLFDAQAHSRWCDRPGTCACGAPQRALLDIAAKRALLLLHANDNDGDCATCAVGATWWGRSGRLTAAAYPCETLRHLAAPFKDHPDYDADAWAPTPRGSDVAREQGSSITITPHAPGTDLLRAGTIFVVHPSTVDAVATASGARLTAAGISLATSPAVPPGTHYRLDLA